MLYNYIALCKLIQNTPIVKWYRNIEYEYHQQMEQFILNYVWYHKLSKQSVFLYSKNIFLN